MKTADNLCESKGYRKIVIIDPISFSLVLLIK